MQNRAKRILTKHSNGAFSHHQHQFWFKNRHKLHELYYSALLPCFWDRLQWQKMDRRVNDGQRWTDGTEAGSGKSPQNRKQMSRQVESGPSDSDFLLGKQLGFTCSNSSSPWMLLIFSISFLRIDDTFSSPAFADLRRSNQICVCVPTIVSASYRLCKSAVLGNRLSAHGN